MIHNCQHWLPQNAILDGELESKFQAIIKRWSAKWFDNSDDFSVSLRAIETNEHIEASSFVWNDEVENITVVLKMSDVSAFSQKLLNHNFSSNHINSADAILFEHISKECIEDLQSGLCKDFLFSGDFSCIKDTPLLPVLNQSDCVLCVKSHDNSVEIKIILPRNFLSAVRKANLAPDISEPDFGLIEDAIGEQVVSLGARVGTGVINLLDVEHLSKGDVLILENYITEPINMTINKSVIKGLNCHIVQDTKTDNLKITQIMMEEV